MWKEPKGRGTFYNVDMAKVEIEGYVDESHMLRAEMPSDVPVGPIRFTAELPRPGSVAAILALLDEWARSPLPGRWSDDEIEAYIAEARNCWDD